MFAQVNNQREKLDQKIINQEWNPNKFVDVEKVLRVKQKVEPKATDPKVLAIEKEVEQRLFEADKTKNEGMFEKFRKE